MDMVWDQALELQAAQHRDQASVQTVPRRGREAFFVLSSHKRALEAFPDAEVFVSDNPKTHFMSFTEVSELVLAVFTLSGLSPQKLLTLRAVGLS